MSNARSVILTAIDAFNPKRFLCDCAEQHRRLQAIHDHFENHTYRFPDFYDRIHCYRDVLVQERRAWVHGHHHWVQQDCECYNQAKLDLPGRCLDCLTTRWNAPSSLNEVERRWLNEP